MTTLRFTGFLALLALVTACSEGSPKDGPPRHVDTEGDLTLEQPGDVGALAARVSAPRVTLLRERDRFVCEVEVLRRPRFSWAELRYGDARSLRWERGRQEGEACSFELPADVSGTLVARIGYPDGQTWRLTLDL